MGVGDTRDNVPLNRARLLKIARATLIAAKPSGPSSIA